MARLRAKVNVALYQDSVRGVEYVLIMQFWCHAEKEIIVLMFHSTHPLIAFHA